MKFISKLTIMLICIILFSCEKEENNQIVIIQTDKEVYSIGESVSVEIINHYNNGIDYSICSSYTGIPPIIWKYEENDWTGYWAPICNGYESYCCEELEANESYEDMFLLEFEKGKYRIEYCFVIEDGQECQSLYSNEFIME